MLFECHKMYHPLAMYCLQLVYHLLIYVTLFLLRSFFKSHSVLHIQYWHYLYVDMVFHTLPFSRNLENEICIVVWVYTVILYSTYCFCLHS